MHSPTRRATARRLASPGVPIAALLLVGLSCNREPTGPSGSLRLRWSQAQNGAATHARPVVVGDVVYFGTGDGRVVARDRTTGVQRWASVVAPDQVVQGANLVARAGVVVVPVLFETVGLDAATGAELWRYTSPPDTVGRGAGYAGQLAYSHVDADDETAYIPAWGASVSAVDLHTGAVRWVWEPGISAGDTATSGRFRSGSMGVRVSGDTVFATVWHFLDAQGLKSDQWVIALDRATGRELWRVVLPSYTGGTTVWGAPAFHANLVLVASNGGHAWAVDRTTRQIVWHYVPQTKFATMAEPEVADGVVFVDGGDDYLYALDASTGALRWKTNAGNGATRDLLVTATRIYYPSNGFLRVFDRATGRAVASMEVKPTGDAVESPAATDGSGHVFVTVSRAAQSFAEP